MLGVVLQGEACAIFLRERILVRSRKYKRTLVIKMRTIVSVQVLRGPLLARNGML